MLLVATLFSSRSEGCAPPEKPAGTEVSRQDARARELLERTAQALKGLSSFSYSGKATTQGATTPSYGATIGAQKTESGTWAILVSGTTTNPDGSAREVHVAYDGVTGRALNDADKVVTESNAANENDVRLFFMSQDAGPLVPWELIGADPLSIAKNGVLELDGRANVDGFDCSVVQVTRSRADASKEITRYFVSPGDALPRRIEQVERVGSANITRTLDLAELKVNEKLAPAQFAISVPDGYTVKSANKKPARPQAPPPSERVDRDDGIANGAKAPGWKMKNAGGVEKSLGDFKGKVVVMDFWGTWCPPCRASMPAIQKVHEKFKGKPVAVLGMNIEHNAKADPAGFMEKNGYTYELFPKAEQVVNDYKIRAFPTLLVISPEGTIVFSEVGYSADLEQKLSKAIEDALIK
jgi:thiol-disulfide isomerase/thioredoxin